MVKEIAILNKFYLPQQTQERLEMFWGCMK